MKMKRTQRFITASLLSVSLLLGNMTVFAEETPNIDLSAFNFPQTVESPENNLLKKQIDRDLTAPQPYSEENSVQFPAQYDLRAQGLSTVVKSQSPLNDCYSFGAIASVESNYLKQLPGTKWQDVNFSEKQLAYFAQHFRPSNVDQPGEGRIPYTKAGEIDNTGVGLDWATVTVALGQLSNGEGVVNTSDVPHLANDGTLDSSSLWTVDEKWRNVSEARLTDAELLPSPANYNNESGAYQYDPAATQDIKRALTDNGAVSVMMGVFTPQTQGEVSKMLEVWNRDTGGYYYYDGSGMNHAVTIVGWDDDFSKDKFDPTGKNRPAGNGAWLIKNSYGTEESPKTADYINRIPDGSDGYEYGYFWLSYYDPTISFPTAYTVDPGADAYDHIQQYDYLNVRDAYSGVETVTQIILDGNQLEGSAKESVANVFTAVDYQTLSAVSVYTPDAGYTADIDIYRGGTPGEPESGILAASLSKNFDYHGFHTVTLGDHAIDLRPGETYTIVQTLTTADGRNFLPVEIGREKTASSSGGYEEFVAVVNPGESYVSTNQGWIDLSTLEASTVNVGGTSISMTTGNAMIKAYTNDREATPAETVMDQINALGAITSLDQEAQVKAARDAYNALNPDEQAQVTNLSVLEAAEAKITELKAVKPTPSAVEATSQTPEAAASSAVTGNVLTGIQNNPALSIAIVFILAAIILSLVVFQRLRHH